MLNIASLVAVAVLFPVSIQAAPQLAGVQCSSAHTVAGVPGGFTDRSYTDFKAVTSGQDATAFLNANGFFISNYPIDAGPVPRRFDTANVKLGEGTLDLVVSAYPGSGYVVGAEIITTAEFQYGSIRTVQKSSRVSGVVEGNFFYASDFQETDWEILTATIDNASACVPKGIWATNQALTPDVPKSSETLDFPFDPREGFHEYRIDWIPGATVFYLDGAEMTRISSNVPNVPGPWIWNAWSNGDPCWSGAPPTEDSVTQIQSIEIYRGYIPEVIVC